MGENMELEQLRPIFEEVCEELELPVKKIILFAQLMTQLNPEFKDPDIGTTRIGVMAVPENEAIQNGCTPGNLFKAKDNIWAGCIRFKKMYEELFNLNRDSTRFNVTMAEYIGAWITFDDFLRKFKIELKRQRDSERNGRNKTGKD